MPDRSIESHRKIIIGHSITYHTLHTPRMILVRFIIRELAYHKPAQASQNTAQAQLLKNTLYLIDRFRDILDKKNRIRADDIVRCRNKLSQHRQITTQKNTLGHSRTVIRRTGESISRTLPAKNPE